MVHGDLPRQHLIWNYLEVFWPCAGGLSAVNAIGTQLRDPINSGLTRWRMAVSINKWTPPRNSGGIPQVSTISSLNMKMSRLTPDGTAEPVSRDQILRRMRGQGNTDFPCSADHELGWQPYPLGPYPCLYVMTIHTYIYTLTTRQPMVESY